MASFLLYYLATYGGWSLVVLLIIAIKNLQAYE